MNIDLTLFGEFITFSVLIFVTWKWVWPPLVNAVEARQKKIADGLHAAERGQKSLELAQEKVSQQLKNSKADAEKLITDARKQMAKIIEDAKAKANDEGKRLLALAQRDISRESELAKEQLRAEIANLVIQTTEKILQKNIDKASNEVLVDKFITELEGHGK